MWCVVRSDHVIPCLDLPTHACKVPLGQTRFGAWVDATLSGPLTAGTGVWQLAQCRGTNTSIGPSTTAINNLNNKINKYSLTSEEIRRFILGIFLLQINAI